MLDGFASGRCATSLSSATVTGRSQPDRIPLHNGTLSAAINAPPRTVTSVRGDACVCEHMRSSHEHYRRGTECALCDCPRFRRQTALRQLLRKLTGQ